MLAESLRTVIEATTARLKPLGYKRRGSTLRLLRNKMCGVIQFQRSTGNTSKQLRFTVNIGVVCGELLPSRTDIRSAYPMDAHASHRLGYLSRGKWDYWWSIDDSTDAGALASGLSEEVVKFAVPFIERYMSPEALIALWESGNSPGLTDGHRLDLLTRLKSKHRS